MVQTFHDFDQAKAAADEADQIVSGYLLSNGDPVYFLTDPDVDDVRMQALVYEARYGEPMATHDFNYLKFLAEQAQ